MRRSGPLTKIVPPAPYAPERRLAQRVSPKSRRGWPRFDRGKRVYMTDVRKNLRLLICLIIAGLPPFFQGFHPPLGGYSLVARVAKRALAG